jgi:hypothetical protein
MLQLGRLSVAHGLCLFPIQFKTFFGLSLLLESPYFFGFVGNGTQELSEFFLI